MKEVIALQEYSDKYVSFYEGEIRNIDDYLANILIAKNVVRLHTDIPEGGGSGSSGGGTINPGYSVERQWCVEEQTIILSYDSEKEVWSGILQGGYLPYNGAEVEVTLNYDYVTVHTVEENEDSLYILLEDSDEGYIAILQNNNTGITTFQTSIPFNDNEVTVSVQGEKQVTVTKDFEDAVETVIEDTIGQSIQPQVYYVKYSYNVSQDKYECNYTYQQILHLAEQANCVIIATRGNVQSQLAYFNLTVDANHSKILFRRDTIEPYGNDSLHIKMEVIEHDNNNNIVISTNEGVVPFTNWGTQ